MNPVKQKLQDTENHYIISHSKYTPWSALKLPYYVLPYLSSGTKCFWVKRSFQYYQEKCYQWENIRSVTLPLWI